MSQQVSRPKEKYSSECVVGHDRMFVVIVKLLHPGVKAFHFSFLALSQNILQPEEKLKGMH